MPFATMCSTIALSVLMISLFQNARAQFPVPTPALIAFNASIGGRLAFGVPWPEPCFSSYNGVAVIPNSTQCAFVEQNFFNNHRASQSYVHGVVANPGVVEVRSDQFGAYSAVRHLGIALQDSALSVTFQTQYEACMSTGDECELDWTNSTNTAAFAPPAVCKQGSVPPYYVCIVYQKTNFWHVVDSHSLIWTDRCTEHERCAASFIFCEIDKDDSRYQKYWGRLPFSFLTAIKIES